jgi:NlpC/P60 family
VTTARRLPILLLAAVAAWVVVAILGAQRAHALGSAKGTQYCAPHYKPKGCKQPPKSVRNAPPATKQAVRNRPTEAAVGQGNGRRKAERDRAVAWAQAQQKQRPAITTFRGLCEQFVETAYGTYGLYSDAAEALRDLRPVLRRGLPKDAPRGTLMYFKADRTNNNRGHVGISLGHGRMISALSKVQEDDATARYWASLYQGWAEAPMDWPGRPDPSVFETSRGTSVSFAGPSNTTALSGVVTIAVRAPFAAGVQISVYYATNPRVPGTRDWRFVDNASPSPISGGWEILFDTTRIPDQGSEDLATVVLRATALDAAGNPTLDFDSRRFVIDNGTALAQLPDAPPPGPGRETAGAKATTFTDYLGTGSAGEPIEAGTTVDVVCRVQGKTLTDGNAWWYRITSSPWNGTYYASTSAFYNNGQTSGSLEGSPFVDPAIQLC